MLKEAVDAFLSAATASFSDVSFETDVAGQDDPVQGCLLVRLGCYTRNRSSGGGSSGSSRELDGRELQAWQDMVAVAVALMDAGSKRDTASSSSGYGQYDQEEAGGAAAAVALPRLCVAYLDASLSTQLAISRRRTTSKLLRRSAKVRGGWLYFWQGEVLLACDSVHATLAAGYIRARSFSAFAFCPVSISLLHPLLMC
jgi:hypothetical protein